MREIQFRAWDGKEMQYDVLAGAGSENVCDFDGNEVWWWCEPPQVIMQCTGLKDSKGNDIYEGDIVKFDGHIRDEKFTSEIIYDLGMFRPKMWSEPLGFYKYKEVIGNIYENPELTGRTK